MGGESPAKTTDHPDELLLDFLENRLRGNDHTMVEEHLESCERCKREVRELDYVMGTLKELGEEVFCPEPWQLFDFAETGADPDGRISRHLASCCECAECVRAFRSTAGNEEVPSGLHRAVKKRFAGERSRNFLQLLKDRTASSFRPYALGLAAAAAVALIVVLICPGTGTQPRMGLSSVSWDHGYPGVISKGLSRDDRKPLVAVILLFEGPESSMRLYRPDDLYEALKPSPELRRRFDFVSPHRVKEALESRTGAAFDKRSVLDRLDGDLGVSGVVLLTVKPEGGLTALEGEILDVGSGKSRGRKEVRGFEGRDLPSELIHTALSLMDQGEIEQ
ncbi:MAG: zf-HC2 domain-containing protein [Pseudomonadota bacterium]